MRACKPDLLNVALRDTGIRGPVVRDIVGVWAASPVGVLGQELDSELVERESMAKDANMPHPSRCLGETGATCNAD